MIKDRINKKVLKTIMFQEMGLFEWKNNCDLGIGIYEQIDDIIDKYLMMVNGDTIPDIQREIGVILTTSKHLLPFDKRELIWFQQSLGRLKRVRSGIKN